MACAGKHTNTNVHFSVKWGSAGLSSLQSGGLVQSEPCLTQTGLDRRAPCHVLTFSTVFTCYSAAHLCFVPTHQGNLLSLRGNNVNLPLRKTASDLYKTNCRSFPSLPPSVFLSFPLSPATIPSLAISAPLPLCQMVKLFKLDCFLTPAAQNGRGDFKVCFSEAQAKIEWPVSPFCKTDTIKSKSNELV